MGGERAFWTHPCAGRTVSSGGQTATHPTLANPTGMAAGTGVGVSGTWQGLGGPHLGAGASPLPSPKAKGGGVRAGGVGGKLPVPCLPQGRAAAPRGPPVTLSHTTSPPRLTCVRRSGATPSRPALSVGTVGGVCRSGLSLLGATPMRQWPATLLALPGPGNSPVLSWPPLCSCRSFPERPFFSHTHAALPLLGARRAMAASVLRPFTGCGVGGALRLQGLRPRAWLLCPPLPGRQPGAGRCQGDPGLLPVRSVGSDGSLQALLIQCTATSFPCRTHGNSPGLPFCHGASTGDLSVCVTRSVVRESKTAQRGSRFAGCTEVSKLVTYLTMISLTHARSSPYILTAPLWWGYFQNPIFLSH